MSIYWYDESIIAKLREITKDQRITIVPTDTLFRFVASLKNDEVIFPLVTLTRLGYTLQHTQRTPFSHQGYPISKRGNVGDNIVELQSIPCQIDYQLDIISRKRNDNDMYVDEIIFYFVNHPTLKVNIAKGANVDHNFNIFFNPNIEDNSDIESHMSRGEYFRTTMTMYVPDARLWKTTNKPLHTVDPVTVEGTTDVLDESKIYFKEVVYSINENEGE